MYCFTWYRTWGLADHPFRQRTWSSFFYSSHWMFWVFFFLVSSSPILFIISYCKTFFLLCSYRCHSDHVEIIGLLPAGSSLLLPCWFRELNQVVRMGGRHLSLCLLSHCPPKLLLLLLFLFLLLLIPLILLSPSPFLLSLLLQQREASNLFFGNKIS